MALTRNFKETVLQRVQRKASFAQALLDEAATLFLNGEPETARRPNAVIRFHSIVKTLQLSTPKEGVNFYQMQ